MAGQQDPSTRRLTRALFSGDVLDVAPALLGATITHAGVTVRLTEVEAYAGTSDPGSHAFRGPTPRTEVMFGPAGHLYVYFTYGMHWCANIVCGPTGAASAILLRAGEVVGGDDIAAARRPGIARRDWARGPARLATTLALRGEQSGLDACMPGGEVTFARPARRVAEPVIRSGPRVGVSGAGGDAAAYPWRFWLEDEPTVSVYRPAKPRARRNTA
ncbi:DNA-3-methyladenine glycosylase [Pedococcus bigeumensis]|uniref:Putative 3-methyladenine DNA glycosylase n=1 Tax=Pedococcus bigeumensis TaxID=433644 RepID=A0A502D439_9MICO|nr:DNA-3-methyladenine glycosylase [Pedococcus bigeumensis]TPG19694.1 DNA-3-methyladenine glycosylase [Pedococcus bigeumensis]